MDIRVAPGHSGPRKLPWKKGYLVKKGAHLKLHIDKLSLNLLSFI